MSYKGILLSAMLALVAFALPTHVLAAGVDPAVGTWNLDLAKSKPDKAGAQYKSQVRTYTATEGGLSVVVKTVDADGSHESSTSFTYDGKPHPTTNVPDYDTVAVKRLNRGTSKATLSRGGAVIGHLSRVVSKDGKTMTMTTNMTNAKGVKIHEVLVYDRQ